MSQKPKNLRGKRGTYTRVISRTTSESLRLVEPERSSGSSNESQKPVNLTIPPPPKPAGSFVVTSVVHSRGDGGTDSPEDESRSDDISRVTDLETPSCSEETYSREVDEEGANESFTESAQPLVPSEGHTVVTVPFVLPSTHFHNIESTVTSPADVLSFAAMPQQSPDQEKPVTTYANDVFIAKCNRCIGRFQVVKVESIVPFHRGRWTCHDYLDNSNHAPEEGWVFHKERFIKKSDLAQIKILEEQNISTVITSTVTTVTVPHCFGEVCQFKTYSTNILDNSCVTVQSNTQQIMSYAINQPQPAQAYVVSSQAMTSNQPMQYQPSNQRYFPVATTIQQQIFTNQSAIISPSVENPPNIFHQQTLLPNQSYMNQPEYYGGVPYSPRPLTSSNATNISQNTLQNEQLLQCHNPFINQSLMTGAYSAPVQTQYQITPQNQMFLSQSEPSTAGGHSVPMNPFIFSNVPQVSNQNLVQVPNITQPTFFDSQGNSTQINQIPTEQYFPMHTGTNIIPSTISYQHNILQNTPLYQSNVMTTLSVTSSMNPFLQTVPQYVTAHISPPVYQNADINSAQALPLNVSQSNQMLPVYQNRGEVFSNVNQNVVVTQTQNVPIQNVVNTQISSSNIKPMPMQFVGLQENIPSILARQVQGSVIQTPPQTPTSFPVQTVHAIPLQNLNVQASVMNTPPQTPVMDQSILQSTVLPSQNLAATPVSLESVLIHPFSSTPCILTNMCYQFLPVVAYAPVISGQIQRQRYNSTPTLSYSWPSSPTYLSDRETNEIIAHVADYLEREKQNQRGGSTENPETSDLTPVDNEDNEQYFVVVKKGKASPLPAKEAAAPPDLKKDTAITTSSEDTIIINETPKSEPKINISEVTVKSDNESSDTVTENVITTKSVDSSEGKVKEVEENSLVVESIIDSSTENNTLNLISSIRRDTTSIQVDSEDDAIIDTVRFCVENIFQKTMEFVEKKLSKEKKKHLKESKGPTASTLIDRETGRVIIMGDKKQNTYVPPFPTKQADPLVRTESSTTDYLTSMTFISKSYSGEPHVTESVASDDFAETSITLNTQPDWTFPSEVVEAESSELTSPEECLNKISMEVLVSEESQERIAQSCEDVLLSEHLEAMSDSCDSQSDNTVISRATLPVDSNMNDPECDYSDANDLITEEITEDISPDEPITPTQSESGRFVISLLSDSPEVMSSPEVTSPVSPQACGHRLVTCSCLEEIHRVTTCASSVIDHKIEQAMDLVKTHLMNSMRAEVESLKARIAELMERIQQLELENDFLKANASPEVLFALHHGTVHISDAALCLTPTTTQSPTN